MTVIVTVALAFIGYLATYLNGVRLAQRNERLARVNRQLSDFYGPLVALTESNKRIFEAFVEQNARPGGVSIFEADTPPTEAELRDWRLWVTTVFLPNVQAMRDLVVTHADLLLDDEMPPLLLNLCAHVSGYEITAARWAQGDYAQHQSVVFFPGDEVRTYAIDGFDRLKWEQIRLMGRRRRAREKRREQRRKRSRATTTGT
ncbi:hypothetical protein [Prauserella alba]|uniref:Uncharacterized protein n=1 Tax=Prauserella alba TaxID=176898 RepID=A0ABN1VPJ1_9PSEU|nr:hypothetical protein [Prauserella alba]MCP2180832.1 hypothetical protein [Prauserella alba]